MLINLDEWKTKLKWAFVGVVIGLVIHMSYLTHSRLRAEEMRLGGPVPYTVKLRSTIFFPNGTAIRGMDMTRAIRSDGSFVMLSSYENSDSQIYDNKTRKERVIQFASGIKVSINDLTNTKSTVAYKGNPANWQRDPNFKCINSFAGKVMVNSPPEVISGEETVAGYRAVKITRNNSTVWYALDYGCAMVQDRNDWGSQGFSEKNLLTLTPGEPEASLFDVNGNIKEAPPSERMMRPGVTLRPQDTEILRNLDGSYNKNRVVR